MLKFKHNHSIKTFISLYHFQRVSVIITVCCVAVVTKKKNIIGTKYVNKLVCFKCCLTILRQVQPLFYC